MWFRIGLAALFLTAGCYRATVETGFAPSFDKHSQWVHSWVFGLIPPQVVQAEKVCPRGVAVVETRHSFLNQVVAGLTAGIYTPITVTVTCGHMPALSGSAQVVPLQYGATYEEVMEGFAEASDLSVKKKVPVFVEFSGEGTKK